MQNTMNNNNRNEIIMVENDEVVFVSETKLKISMMKILHKSSDYEDLRMKIVKSTIMSGLLCERHPQIDTPQPS